MAVLTIVQALNQALKQEMKNDKKVMFLGEDVGVDGGVFRVTDKLIDEFGPDRCVDSPLAESTIVGSAVGLAISGMKPVAEIEFSGFIAPAFDQIISHAARIRNRSRGRFTCPLVIRAPYGGGIRALEHHSESFESVYAHIPGLKVVIPSTPYDAKGLLIAAIRDPDPVLFLEPKKIYRSVKQEVPEEEYTVEIGKAAVVQEGTDVTVISWGAMMPTVKKALAHSKRSCELIDLRTISPLDIDTIITSVEKTGRVVIVHEAQKYGGYSGELIARINEKAMMSLQAPIKRVCGPSTIFPLYKLEEEYLPKAERVFQAIEEVMQY